MENFNTSRPCPTCLFSFLKFYSPMKKDDVPMTVEPAVPALTRSGMKAATLFSFVVQDPVLKCIFSSSVVIRGAVYMCTKTHTRYFSVWKASEEAHLVHTHQVISAQ